MTIRYQDEQVIVHLGDCLDVLKTLADCSVDSVVTDPPYGLEFMGKEWDSFGGKRDAGSRGGAGDKGILPGYGRGGTSEDRFAFRQKSSNAFGQWCGEWATECLRVLKPGGHLVSFGGTRTWHRLACAIEDAGFEIRDNLAWLYGSGFPKSLDVSKAIDKAAGAEREVVGPGHKGGRYASPLTDMRGGNYGNGIAAGIDGSAITAPATYAAKQWQGWGTALKPAFEPIILARKPIKGTVAANVLEHGTGALNLDACRIGNGEGSQGPRSDNEPSSTRRYTDSGAVNIAATPGPRGGSSAGRFPANALLDGAAAAELDKQSGIQRSGVAVQRNGGGQRIFNQGDGLTRDDEGYGDTGGASRFFPIFKYTAKAPGDERPSVDGVRHPTVKPVGLMRWLVKLVTPPHGVVLDPFAGTGTTGEAAIHEYMRAILIEREADYLPLIVARLSKPMEIGFDFCS